MDKSTVLGIINIIAGIWLLSSKIAFLYEENVRSILENIGLSWNYLEIILDFAYMPAIIVLIFTGIILTGFIIIFR